MVLFVSIGWTKFDELKLASLNFVHTYTFFFNQFTRNKMIITLRCKGKKKNVIWTFQKYHPFHMNRVRLQTGRFKSFPLVFVLYGNRMLVPILLLEGLTTENTHLPKMYRQILPMNAGIFS